MENQKDTFEDRRKHIRIDKNLLLTFYELNNPEEKFQVSQIKNISKGGLCIVTTRKYEPNIKLGIELKTPFFGETMRLEGTTLESRQMIEGILFETHFKFDAISPESEIILEKIEQYFNKEQQNNN